MAIWLEVLARLDHPDVWGPGADYLARCPNPAHPDRHPSFSMPKGEPSTTALAMLSSRSLSRSTEIADVLLRSQPRPRVRLRPRPGSARAGRSALPAPDLPLMTGPRGPAGSPWCTV